MEKKKKIVPKRRQLPATNSFQVSCHPVLALSWGGRGGAYLTCPIHATPQVCDTHYIGHSIAGLQENMLWFLAVVVA